MAIVHKPSSEPYSSVTKPVAEYDLSDSLGILFPYSYDESFKTFKELINDKENGIPEDIREKLAAIYTQTGESLVNNHLAFRAVYSIDNIEEEIDRILTDEYDLPEEMLSDVKKAAQINEQTMRKFLIGAVTWIDDSSAVGEIVSEIFSRSVSDDLAQHLEIKIREGALPMLESDGSGSFDMS